MTTWLLAAALAASSPARAQDAAPPAGTAVSGDGTSTGGVGLGAGAADKAPGSNPADGAGRCVDQPDPPAPRPGGPLFAQHDFGTGTFPDVAFYRGKLWIALRREAIELYSAAPDLTGLALVKSFPLLPGAGGFPRLTVACGALWLAYRDGEPAEAIKLWRSDTGAVQDLGPGWGNHPVTLGQGMVAWQSLSGPAVMRRGLAGGPAVRLRGALPTGVSRILPGGQVRMWDEDRLMVPWGIGAWYAGDAVAAEDFNDDGVWVSIAGAKPFHLWAGSRAFTPKIAADGSGRYAVGVWQPTVRVAVFDAAGGSAGAASVDPLIWTEPASGASGPASVRLAGAARPNVRRVEILVNKKKVGDAALEPPIWHYQLDAGGHVGGINVSALATLEDGTTFRQTIRYNVLAAPLAK